MIEGFVPIKKVIRYLPDFLGDTDVQIDLLVLNAPTPSPFTLESYTKIGGFLYT